MVPRGYEAISQGLTHHRITRARGETDALSGWLAYGAALNEGRALFPGDREFSAWMAEWQLAIQVEAHERAAATWAAANADQLAEAH